MRNMVFDSHLGLAEARCGRFAYNRNDVFMGKALELYGEYNQSEADFLSRLTPPNSRVIEAGANIGCHTVLLAKLAGAGGRVFAFEPQRHCFALLQAQLALNRLDNVRAFNEGLGAEDGALWLPPQDYEHVGNFGGVALEKQPQSDRHEQVAVRRIDGLFYDSPINLIKIDVEGMELDIIRGGAEVIKRYHPALYVENDRPDRSPELIAEIQGLGYRLWWHMPPLFNPDNFFHNADNIYGDMVSVNMLCLHGGQEIKVDGLAEIISPYAPHPCVKTK